MWIIWLIIGMALISLEMLTGDLVLLLLGAAAVAAGAAAGLGLDPAWQVATFVVFAGFLLGTVRPVAKHLLHRTSTKKQTGMAALIGRTGVVTSTPVQPHNVARIVIGSEEWRAMTEDGNTLQCGERVRIFGFEGATLLVESEEAPLLAASA